MEGVMGWAVTIAVVIVLEIVVIFGWALIMALPTMILWNWLMPAVFEVQEISFFQAFGLNLLTGILFRNSGAKVSETKRKGE